MRAFLFFLAVAAIAIAGRAYAQQTGVPITSLTSASSVTGSEAIPAIAGSTAEKITPAQIQAFILAAANTWTSPNIFGPPSSGNTLTVTQQGANNALILNSAGNATNGNMNLSFDSSGNFYIETAVSGIVMETLGSSPIHLRTNSVDRLTVDQNGAVSIDTPSAGIPLTINAPAVQGIPQLNFSAPAATEVDGIEWSQGSQAPWQLYQPPSSTDLRFYNGGDRLILSAGGSILAPNIPAGGGVTGYLCWSSSGGNITYDTSSACSGSSERFKTNIRSLNWALGEVEALRSVSYTLKPQYDPQYHGKKAQLGFLAEDVAKVDPRLVEYDKSGKPLTVIYDRVTVLLVKALQEEHRHVLELAGAVAALTFWNLWLSFSLNALRRRVRG